MFQTILFSPIYIHMYINNILYYRDILLMDIFHKCTYTEGATFLKKRGGNVMIWLFIFIGLVYIYFCLKVIPFENIEFNFNIISKIKNLCYYSNDKFVLAFAILITVLLPSIIYTIYILISLTFLNYKLIILVLLGIHSLFVIYNYILYNNNFYKSNLNTTDLLFVKAISAIFISMSLLVILSIIGISYNILFINIFILSTHGLIINIDRTVTCLYYKYRNGYSLLAHLSYTHKHHVEQKELYKNIVILYSIAARYILMNILFSIPLLFLLIIILCLIYFYFYYWDKLNKELTFKSKCILSFFFIIFCLLRFYAYHYTTDLLDMKSSLDNNEISGSSQDQNNRDNFTPRRLPDLPDINRPARPILPCISTMNSHAWNEVSSTLGIRNSAIVRHGINHDLPPLNRDRSFQFLHLQNRHNTMPSIASNLPLHYTRANNLPIVSNIGNEASVPSNNSNTVLQWQEPIAPKDTHYFEAPSWEVYNNYYLTNNCKYMDGFYKIRFSNHFVSDFSDGNSTPPIPSSPKYPGYFLEQIPDNIDTIDGLIPECDVTAEVSNKERITTDEFWDRIHDHPLRKEYLNCKDKYMLDDFLPYHVRIKIFYGYVMYEPHTKSFAWSDIDMVKEREKYKGSDVDNWG